ncbi:hypothetical protein AeMF1_014270 [Aphanomyces euteiches]|nr:hypothetical protein AeMF1_014270 [Aphanomyces euteiches]
MASMRKSGVPEDFEEREVLLTDIKTRIDDYVEVDAARKDTDKKKKEGIETSGLMLQKRKRPSHTKAGVVEGILSSIKEGLAAKREKDELLLAERRERFEFDKAQAQATADRFAASQQMMLSLINKIVEKS